MLRPSSGCNSAGGGGGLTAAAIDGAPAATALALADVFPVSQAGTLAKASIQQALNAIGLLAADAVPAESDMIPAVQGGVALYLALSALRTKLDTYGSARNIQASQISLSTGTALQLPTIAQLGGTSSSFPALKRSGQIAQVRLADDAGWAGFACSSLGVYRVTTENIVLSAGGYYIGIFAESGQPSLRFTVTANAENGHDIMLSRAAAGVLSVDGSALGDALGQLKCAGATGAGTPVLGSNCPATTLTAPYTWLKFTATDGSQVYVPAWK